MTSSPLSEFGDTQAVANIVHALAKLKQPNKAIMSKVNEEAEWMVKEGKPQHIANTAWAFAKMDVRAPDLFKEIETRASFLVKEGNPQDIANTAWAYRKLQYDAPTLLAAVDSASEVLIKSGKPQEISNVALAFAEIGHKPDSFFNCLEKHADEFVKSASEQAIINVSWSLVTLGLASENEALLQTLWKRAIETDASKLPREALLPLVQVDVHARTSGAKLPPAPPGLKWRMIQAVKVTTESSSPFEDEYSALLADAGFKHQREVQFLDGEYADFMAIDFACKERKIAVEYDGASHFLTELKKGARPNHGRENGPTTAKRRLMEQMGWKVANIDYKDNIKMEIAPKWVLEKEGGVREMKMKYLRNRLEKVGVTLYQMDDIESMALKLQALKVGTQIEVYWPNYKRYYQGKIKGPKPIDEDGHTRVLYENGDDKFEDLENEIWRLGTMGGGSGRVKVKVKVY